MHTGYPRFFIHRSIVALGDKIVERFGNEIMRNRQRDNASEHAPTITWQAMLFPDRQAAVRCAAYISRMSVEPTGRDPPPLYISEFSRSRPKRDSYPSEHQSATDWANAELHAVLYPADSFLLAKAFWQHTGFGISSRYAEHCLDCFNSLQCLAYYLWSASCEDECLPRSSIDSNSASDEIHIPNGSVESKVLIRKRVATLAASEGITVDVHDVFLHPTGMTSITCVVDAIQGMRSFEGRRTMVAYG